MVVALPISPGIDGIPTTTIPDDPEAFVTWFKSIYLRRWAANADIRNASSANPVVVTGNLATPAALSLSAAATALINAIETVPNDTVVGNVSGATGTPSALTEAQLLTLINLNVADSITGSGQVGNPLELSGDVATPGNTYYYGTNASGTKGWYTLPSGGGSGANPTASVGLTAVNGSATTFLRSDGAPALAQTIVPTWTGLHTFNASAVISAPASSVALTVNGTATSGGYNTMLVQAQTSAGQSYGMDVRAGTNSSDRNTIWRNAAASATLMTLAGDGGLTVGSAPTGGDKGAGTINVSGGLYVNGVAGWRGGGSSITTLVQSGGASQSIDEPACNFVQVICISGGGGGGSAPQWSPRPVTLAVAAVGGGAESLGAFRAADLRSTVTVTFTNTAGGGAGRAPLRWAPLRRHWPVGASVFGAYLLSPEAARPGAQGQAARRHGRRHRGRWQGPRRHGRRRKPGNADA